MNQQYKQGKYCVVTKCRVFLITT